MTRRNLEIFVAAANFSFSLVYHKDQYINAALDAFRRVCAEFGAQEK